MRRHGMTLVETVVALAVVGLLGLLAAGGAADFAEESRTAKCQSNLKRMISAIHVYVADYDGVLPGPVHPAIKRHLYDLTGSSPTADRKKSLSWLLRPYLSPPSPAHSDPALPDPATDEVMRCPTATLLVPDDVFFSTANGQSGCWRERPWNYVCNTWGPIAPAGTLVSPTSADWQSTDPPHYFGIWYYCDASPVRSDVAWCPKRLDAIANPSSEWATGDAWYRRTATSGRGGPAYRRVAMGTYPANQGEALAPIPSAPYHRTPLREARSHLTLATPTLPLIPFTGETNLAYFDGHVAALRADWVQLGDGGSVNPYWDNYGGTHASTEPWQPAAYCGGTP